MKKSTMALTVLLLVLTSSPLVSMAYAADTHNLSGAVLSDSGDDGDSSATSDGSQSDDGAGGSDDGSQSDDGAGGDDSTQ